MVAFVQNGNFQFKECTLIPISTGIQARNLQELREGIEEVPISCLHYHFWGRILSPQFPESEYVNDFASWTREYLHETALSEKLSALSPDYKGDLEELRDDLIDLLDESFSSEHFMSWKQADRAFHFTQTQLIIVETSLVAESPENLAEAVASSSRGSIFFHFIEAKRRVREDRRDDFSRWLEHFGETTAEAREKLSILDPYLYSLTELREKIVAILGKSLVIEGVERL
ncbi:MAG: DUF5752 family protein [Aminobacterium sp.]|jgi:hypothetical protein|nr:DUF5752 family protein [Aminobacterium sp.]MDD3706833.1 DUF5752 family protein [Aminobacterium sp.]